MRLQQLRSKECLLIWGQMTCGNRLSRLIEIMYVILEEYENGIQRWSYLFRERPPCVVQEIKNI